MTDEIQTFDVEDEEWGVTPEQQAEVDQAQSYFWPLKESPQGTEPPLDVSDSHAWKHSQREAIEVVSAKVSGAMIRKQKLPHMRVDLEVRCIQATSKAADKRKRIRLDWAQDPSERWKSDLKQKGILDKLVRASGLEVIKLDDGISENFPATIRQLNGVRVWGLLVQGYRMGKKNAGSNETPNWVDSGEFKEINEFTMFEPIDAYDD